MDYRSNLFFPFILFTRCLTSNSVSFTLSFSLSVFARSWLIHIWYEAQGRESRCIWLPEPELHGSSRNNKCVSCVETNSQLRPGTADGKRNLCTFWLATFPLWVHHLSYFSLKRLHREDFCCQCQRNAHGRFTPSSQPNVGAVTTKQHSWSFVWRHLFSRLRFIPDQNCYFEHHINVVLSCELPEGRNISVLVWEELRCSNADFMMDSSSFCFVEHFVAAKWVELSPLACRQRQKTPLKARVIHWLVGQSSCWFCWWNVNLFLC